MKRRAAVFAVYLALVLTVISVARAFRRPKVAEGTKAALVETQVLNAQFRINTIVNELRANRWYLVLYGLIACYCALSAYTSGDEISEVIDPRRVEDLAAVRAELNVIKTYLFGKNKLPDPMMLDDVGVGEQYLGGIMELYSKVSTLEAHVFDRKPPPPKGRFMKRRRKDEDEEERPSDADEYPMPSSDPPVMELPAPNPGETPEQVDEEKSQAVPSMDIVFGD